jgi:alkaline phosphatase D
LAPNNAKTISCITYNLKKEMKKILSKTFLGIAILIFSLGDTYGQRDEFLYNKGNGDQNNSVLIDNMLYLNQFDHPLPVEQQMLYKYAEARLALESSRSYEMLANFKDFQKHCTENNIKTLGGPMLGNVSTNSVNVWTRTIKPASVEVLVSAEGKEKRFGPLESGYESQLSVVIPLTGLEPGVKYAYKVFVDGEKIETPFETSFHTISDKNEDNTRILFGSCFHRWGLGNEKQSKSMLAREADAFLAIGDIAVQDKLNHVGWHSLDYLARDLYPAWQDLVSKVPVYAAWDDHDYFRNDGWGIPPGYTNEDREKVWEVFRYSWANPYYGFGDDEKGVFFRTRIGAADVILLDHRYFRTKSSFLGEKQMLWLEEQLLDCKGPFIVLSCGTMWSDYVSDGKDSWGQFDPEAREKIFSLIEKNNIQGVLLISGDRHGARGFTIPRPSGFKFYEFEGASLGGRGGPSAKTGLENRLYVVKGEYAFSEFTFDTKKKDPTVTFRLIGEEGNILHELDLKRSELTPANYSPAE